MWRSYWERKQNTGKIGSVCSRIPDYPPYSFFQILTTHLTPHTSCQWKIKAINNLCFPFSVWFLSGFEWCCFWKRFIREWISPSTTPVCSVFFVCGSFFQRWGGLRDFSDSSGGTWRFSAGFQSSGFGVRGLMFGGGTSGKAGVLRGCRTGRYMGVCNCADTVCTICFRGVSIGNQSVFLLFLRKTWGVL